ncbi:MAG: hypothetical protein K2J77_05415 [Oscillospiraceae bacterium]|nr:hypothetical protein [Oscillospiraceae bacterium]
MKNTKHTDEVSEKVRYTLIERLAEIFCGALMAAALFFYLRLVLQGGAADIIVVMMIATAVYIALTGLSVHPELISKPEHLHRNRRIFLVVKTVLTALLLVALVMMTFPSAVEVHLANYL